METRLLLAALLDRAPVVTVPPAEDPIDEMDDRPLGPIRQPT